MKKHEAKIEDKLLNQKVDESDQRTFASNNSNFSKVPKINLLQFKKKQPADASLVVKKNKIDTDEKESLSSLCKTNTKNFVRNETSISLLNSNESLTSKLYSDNYYSTPLTRSLTNGSMNQADFNTFIQKKRESVINGNESSLLNKSSESNFHQDLNQTNNKMNFVKNNKKSMIDSQSYSYSIGSSKNSYQSRKFIIDYENQSQILQYIEETEKNIVDTETRLSEFYNILSQLQQIKERLSPYDTELTSKTKAILLGQSLLVSKMIDCCLK